MLNMIMKIIRFNLHIKMVIFYHIIGLIHRIFCKIKNIYHEKKLQSSLLVVPKIDKELLNKKMKLIKLGNVRLDKIAQNIIQCKQHDM